jgi:hypothetical protein
MKIVLEKSDKNQQRHSSSAEREEFLESVEDQSNDESPEDHCTDSETHAGPSRQHPRPSHSSR